MHEFPALKPSHKWKKLSTALRDQSEPADRGGVAGIRRADGQRVRRAHGSRDSYGGRYWDFARQWLEDEFGKRAVP